MTPRRRQPPLFEALGDSARRENGTPPSGATVHPATSGTVSAAGTPNASIHPPAGSRVPVVVEVRQEAIGAPSGPSRNVGGGLGGWARNRSAVIGFLMAAMVILFAVVWAFAYRLGHERGQQSVLSHTEIKDAAAITGQNTNPTPVEPLPESPNQNANKQLPVPPPKGGTPIPTSAPDLKHAVSGMPPVIGPDSRKPGFNYLEIVELTWRDAEPAVRFLQANGVRASAFPLNKQVDPAKMESNNRVRVFVDQPYASGEQFRSSQTERNELVATIRRVGKKWQSEHKGASDFQEPMWRLQRGK